MRTLQCDVCKKIIEVKFDKRIEDKWQKARFSVYSGQSNGGRNASLDVCPECSPKLTKLTRESFAEFIVEIS